VAVDTPVDEDANGRVEMQGVAARAALEAAGAHCALLEECTMEESGGTGALMQGREGTCCVVAKNDDGPREAELNGRRLKSQDAGECPAPILVVHAIRVREGADDDLALPVRPPTQDHAPPA
jgi:hypothetical protein